MADVYHYFGSDLTVSSTGDLFMADGIDLSNQRIIRRLMTIDGEYIWHPEYGGALPLRVGGLNGALFEEDAGAGLDTVSAIVRSQMFLEEAVQRVPEPEIATSKILNGAFVSIKYTDALSGRGVSLDFDAVI